MSKVDKKIVAMHVTLKAAEKVQIRIVFAVGGITLAVIFGRPGDSIYFGQPF